MSLLLTVVSFLMFYYEITMQYGSVLKCNYDITVQCVNILRAVLSKITALETDLKLFTVVVLL